MQILLETLQKHTDEIKANVVSRLESILTHELYTHAQDEIKAYARSKLRDIIRSIVDEIVSTDTFPCEGKEVNLREYVYVWLHKPNQYRTGPRILHTIDALVTERAEHIIRELTVEELSNLSDKLKDRLAEIMVEKLRR